MGLAAVFGLAAAPTVLTVSDAEAQTAGMERREMRRTDTTTGTGTGTTNRTAK